MTTKPREVPGTDCNCVDCGGTELSHSPTCKYMKELHNIQEGDNCLDAQHSLYVKETIEEISAMLPGSIHAH